MTTDFHLQVHRTFERFKQSDTTPASTDIFVAHLHPWIHSNSKSKPVNCQRQLQYNVNFIILKLKIYLGNKGGSIHFQNTEATISMSTMSLKMNKRKILRISSLTNYKTRFYFKFATDSSLYMTKIIP
jgi:hypothetical protein